MARVIALLRGVTPSGKNSIPKMSVLIGILEGLGFERVQTYIQSGNILLDTNIGFSETAKRIHDAIYENIGADLSIIIKTKEDLQASIAENPFNKNYDYSRIHLVFTNDEILCVQVKQVREMEFFGEVFHDGSACLYMYLPRDASKKKLNNNYLERKLGIVATTRKLNVIQHLHDMFE